MARAAMPAAPHHTAFTVARAAWVTRSEAKAEDLLSATRLPRKDAHQLYMGRPQELVHREHPFQLETGVHESAGVAHEGGRIAGDADLPRHTRAGQLRGLFRGAGARGVEQGDVDLLQLLGQHRAAIEIAG